MSSWHEENRRHAEAVRRLQGIVERIDFRNSPVPVRLGISSGHHEDCCHIELQVFLKVPDRDTGNLIWAGRANSLTDLALSGADKGIKDESIVRLIRFMVAQALTHEVEECMHLDGKRIFDPHKEKST